ncbi:MAG: YdcF family protein, partial [Acidobacteriota bacterium]
MKRHLTRSAIVLAVLLIIGSIAFARLGAFLVISDPLQKADAIVVLGGTMYERQMEAVDLYKAGMAPRICLFREISDYGERELIARGVPFLRSVDVQIDAMAKLGVPRDAITILDEADSTADEASHLLGLVTRDHLSSVIIITSKQHTRR